MSEDMGSARDSEESAGRGRGADAVRVGMGQMAVRWGAAAENLDRAAEMIRRAADEGCEVVVLPECLDLGWTHPEAPDRAEPIPGPRSGALCRAAGEAGILVAAGLTERAGDHTYNAAVLISPEGDVLLKHRKINLLTIAEDVYSVGDSLGVAECERLGRVAVNICADNFPSSLALAHSQARMGARLLLSPSAWAVEADHDNEKEPYGEEWRRPYAELARLYDVAVVGVSSVGRIEGGPWKGRRCIGCSLAVGPSGRVLAKGPYGESAGRLIPVDVPLRGLDVKGTALADHLKGRGYEGP